MKQKKQKRNKAQAMVVVFIYISVVSLMGIYMMVYASNLHNMVIREINYTKAFYAGEAALIQSFSQLCNASPPTAASGAVNMTYAEKAIGVTATDIGDGYFRLVATISNWQQW